MTKLSINVNKIATLRNARGGDNPNVVQFAKECERLGADSISVHPWPDERHIRLGDVYQLSQTLTIGLNIEGYPTPEFVALIRNIKPQQVTLMPDSPTQLTSNAGWDTVTQNELLSEVVEELKMSGTRTSVFVSPDKKMVEFAAKAGADRVELYAGTYARMFADDAEAAVAPFVEAADYAHRLGLGVNAGHDLDLENVAYFVQRVPWLEEVSIGHAFVCDAVYKGLEQTILDYKKAVSAGK